MKGMHVFIKDFKNRGGITVILSSLFLKFCSLLTSIFVVRLISKDTLGDITFAMSVISIVTVFAGLGSNWSLLRYGALLKTYSEKFKMFRFSIINGAKFTIYLFLMVILISFLLPQNVHNAQIYLIILAVGLFSGFLFESLLSYFRILNKNKLYSKANTYGSFLLVLLTFLLAYFFSGIGYTIAIVLAPLLSFLIYKSHVFYKKIEVDGVISVNVKEYYKYGIYTGVGMIANQMIISSGGMLAGFLGASNKDIAMYRVATIIPFNLMFIPLMIMTSDFVHFSKNQNSKKILINYYLNYLKTIFMISCIPFVVFFVFNKELIILLFGNEYSNASTMSFYLMVAIFFSFMFRIPLGNMLSAVGKANWNVVHSIVWFFLFIPLTIVLFRLYGIDGIAMSITIVIIVSGFVALILFYKYLNSI